MSRVPVTVWDCFIINRCIIINYAESALRDPRPLETENVVSWDRGTWEVPAIEHRPATRAI